MTYPCWTFRVAGREVGPLRVEEVEQLVVRGEIDYETLGRHLDGTEWEPAGLLFPEVFDRRADEATNPATSIPAAPVTLEPGQCVFCAHQTNRSAAAVCRLPLTRMPGREQASVELPICGSCTSGLRWYLIAYLAGLAALCICVAAIYSLPGASSLVLSLMGILMIGSVLVPLVGMAVIKKAFGLCDILLRRFRSGDHATEQTARRAAADAINARPIERAYFYFHPEVRQNLIEGFAPAFLFVMFPGLYIRPLPATGLRSEPFSKPFIMTALGLGLMITLAVMQIMYAAGKQRQEGDQLANAWHEFISDVESKMDDAPLRWNHGGPYIRGRVFSNDPFVVEQLPSQLIASDPSECETLVLVEATKVTGRLWRSRDKQEFRWEYKVKIVDCVKLKVIGRQTFMGQMPSSFDRDESPVGHRPVDKVVQWVSLLPAGP